MLSTEMGARKPLAEIGYHDLLALMVSLDSEWSRQCRSPGDFPPHENHVQFRRNCHRFADEINDSYDDWHKANDPSSTPKDWVDRHLYNPLSYFPLGHADDGFLVLIDDLAPAHDLTVRIRRRIEDVALGYCLKMEDLKSTATWTRRGRHGMRALAEHPEAGVLCDLEQRFDTEHGPVPPSERKARSRDVSSPWTCHATHRQFPFLVFTRFHMDGIGAVTQYLLAQQALYKAMGLSVCNTLGELRRIQQSSRSPDTLVLSSRDLEDTKVSFLDLAGTEETGALFFCRNLSVAMSMVSQIRKLTYADAFQQEQELQRQIEKDDCYRLVVKQWQRLPQSGRERQRPEPSSAIDHIQGTHLFRWSNSSVFVSPCALLDKRARDECGGAIYGEVVCQLSPGHHKRMRQVFHGISSPKRVRDPGWDLFPVGDYDLAGVIGGEPIVPTGRGESGSGNEVRPLVRSADLLRYWLEVTRQDIKAGKGRRFLGRNCVEMSLRLEVPIPFLDNDSQKNWHCSVLMEVLTAVQAKLVQDPAGGNANSRRFIPMSMSALRHVRGRWKLPRHLRQTIETLYQVFYAMLADSYRFDLVLDLYDVFATLHRLITSTLCNADESAGDPDPELRVCDSDRVGRIELLVSAIENALSHRMAKVFANSSPLDMAVDFRGGMNQMILGAAAPMICSLGLFRKCVVEPSLRKQFGDDERELLRHHPQSHVGVVSRISLMSGMQSCPLDLDYRSADDLHLAHYEADVPHILHIPRYVDYFHETGHMVFRSIVQLDSDSEFRTDTLDPLRREGHDARVIAGITHRLSEIFALLFGQVFVFGTDRETAFTHHLVAFCQSLDSVGRDQVSSLAPELESAQVGTLDGIHRFAEILFRLAAVKILLPPDHGDISIGDWIREPSPLPSLEDAETDFARLLTRAIPYHPSFETQWQGTELETTMREHGLRVFREGYQSLRPYLAWVRHVVATVYKRYLREARLPAGSEVDDIKAALRVSFDRGYPILRCMIPAASPPGTVSQRVWREPRDSFLDPLFLISQLLAKHIGDMQAPHGKHMIRRRKFQDARTAQTAREENSSWHEYLIDQGSAALFCPVPTTRRKRTLQQIVIRKALRDVAATFHGRRLFRVIYDTLAGSD